MGCAEAGVLDHRETGEEPMAMLDGGGAQGIGPEGSVDTPWIPPTHDARPDTWAVEAPDADGAIPAPMADASTVDTMDAGTAPDTGTNGEGEGHDAALEDAGTPDATTGDDGEGCQGDADTDGDGLPDCDELGDDDPFTDPAVFNGARVQTRTHAFLNPSCDAIDTVTEVEFARGYQPLEEELDQVSGWDFEETGDSRTEPGYGFRPPWTMQNTRWQIDAQGFFQAEAGQHCFEITGAFDQSCGSLFVLPTPASEFTGWNAVDGNTPALAFHGSGVACLTLEAGTYPIRWHYEMDNLRGPQAFHLRHCHSTDSECTPAAALSTRRLRVTR